MTTRPIDIAELKARREAAMRLVNDIDDKLERYLSPELRSLRDHYAAIVNEIDGMIARRGVHSRDG
jgi:hypothetical protein